MILAPTNRWGDWAEAAGAEENMVSYTFVRDVVCPQLRKEGFAVPARQLLVRTLEAALSLMQYIEHNQVFPSHEDMLPNLETERLEHKLALENLVMLMKWPWVGGTCKLKTKENVRPHQQA